MKRSTAVLLGIGGYAFYKAGGVYYAALLGGALADRLGLKRPGAPPPPKIMPPICIDNCDGTVPAGSLNPNPPMVGIPVTTPIASRLTPTRVGMSGYLRTRR